jgi:hypothetical protein
MEGRGAHHSSERLVREGELFAVADDELDIAETGRKLTRPLDHPCGNVDADGPLHHLRRGTNRSTCTAANIEESVIGG